MNWHIHKLGIIFSLFFWIMGCGSDESLPVGLPANVLGSWSGTFNESNGISGTWKLNVSRAAIDSSTPNGSVKIDGTIEIGSVLLQIPIPEPLSLTPEDQPCLNPPTFPFQSAEVKGDKITIDTEITACLRSNLPPITATFRLNGTVFGNQIIGSFEIVAVHPQAPGGEFTANGTFVLVNQAGPPPSFNNFKKAPLEILGEWNGEWSNDMTKETGTIKVSINEIFVTPDTLLDVVELDTSISLSPLSTQCFSELVDLTSSGEINGKTFTLKAPFNGLDISILFEATMENSEIGGTFEITGTEGTCLGHTGTWKVNRQ